MDVLPIQGSDAALGVDFAQKFNHMHRSSPILPYDPFVNCLWPSLHWHLFWAPK